MKKKPYSLGIDYYWRKEAEQAHNGRSGQKIEQIEQKITQGKISRIELVKLVKQFKGEDLIRVLLEFGLED